MRLIMYTHRQRIVKARGISQNESPYVRIGNSVHSKPGIPRLGEPPSNPEWHQHDNDGSVEGGDYFDFELEPTAKKSRLLR
ncbi:hypothetical protein L1887_12268 [Cichorium endivia]|nr:hypothetical protein L1887_12268 [Cichorium endivia]